MKLYLILAVVLLGMFRATADDLPAHEVTLSIDSASPNGLLKIGVHNQSKKAVRVWVSCYSWAYFNWRAVVIRGNEMRFYCPNPNEMFTMNFPDFATIGPGKMMTEELQLGADDDVWKNDVRPLMHWTGPKDTKPLLQDGDKIIVTYDVRWSAEANKFKVWTGLTAVNKDYHPAARN
jgi:hypothetical protein